MRRHKMNGGSRDYSLGHKFGLNGLHIHLARLLPFARTQGGGDPGALADIQRYGHRAEIGMGDVGTGDIATGEEETVHGLWHERPVGQRVFPFLRKFILRAVRVEAGTGERMDVKVEEAPRGNPVIEDTGVLDVLLLDDVKALKVARLPHAEHGRGTDYEAVLVTRRVAAQEIHDDGDLFAAADIPARQILDIGAID